ncbi:MAG: hypothetical protein VCA36_09745, partial [Opitutales bacterium]
MFATIIRIFKHTRAVSEEFSKEDSVDPSEFDDPLAEYVEWTPLGPNGAYPPMQRLRKEGIRRMSSRIALMGFLLLCLFGIPAAFVSLVLGVISLLLTISILAGPWGYESLGILIATGVMWFLTFVVGLIGYVFISRTAMPIVFDKQGGFFRRGFYIP